MYVSLVLLLHCAHGVSLLSSVDDDVAVTDFCSTDLWADGDR